MCNIISFSPNIDYKVPLGQHRIPANLRKEMKSEKARFLLPTFWGTTEDGRTSPEVHCKRLSTLLHVEELQMELDIRKYDIDRTTFRQERNGYLALHVPGLIENRPSLIRGDRLFARKLLPNQKADGKEYEGFVHEIQLNEVRLKFNPV